MGAVVGGRRRHCARDSRTWEPVLAEVAARFRGDLIRQDGSSRSRALAPVSSGVREPTSASRASTPSPTPSSRRARGRSCAEPPTGALAVYDIPLLIEGDQADRFDAVVIVDAPIEERDQAPGGQGSGARGCACTHPRPGLVRRSAAQSRTIWIDNEGSADDLEEVARLVYRALADPGRSRHRLTRPGRSTLVANPCALCAQLTCLGGSVGA